MKVGLVGNPNVGKSLIFHQLTGIGVNVSNYPGTTVDLLVGTLCYEGERIELVDLPGIYSLEGRSPEEETVRNFILEEDVERLVAVLDATHLERNLYLFLQVAEFKKPLVVVLNMMDEAAKRGIEIDIEKLSSILGVEVIPVTAIQGKNVQEIIPAALSRSRVPTITVPYDLHIEAAIRSLVSVYGVSRIVALQALQGIADNQDLAESARTLAREIEEMHRMSVQQIIAGNRHHCAKLIAERVIREKEVVPVDSLDSLLTSRIWGPHPFGRTSHDTSFCLLHRFVPRRTLSRVFRGLFYSTIPLHWPRSPSPTNRAFGTPRISGRTRNSVSLHLHILSLHLHPRRYGIFDEGSLPCR